LRDVYLKTFKVKEKKEEMGRGTDEKGIREKGGNETKVGMG
jgi:hypothetical protein